VIPISDTVLPQGAPTSPYIANILTKKLDIRLMSLAEKVGAGYSRYADDLTFSSDEEIPSINTIDKIISEEGFTINRSKTKIQKRGGKQRVTGLTITNGVHVPKQYKKDILYHLHYCKLNGPIEHMKVNNITRASFKDWLYGKICYVHSIEPETGKKMMNLFNSIDWLM
jgi:RNA-directed DNA polymerase